MKKTGNTIFVTGGGSGIGQALAQRWHDAGNHVIVTGRRQQALDETIAGRERMAAYVLDVTEDDLDAFVKRVVADHPKLNVLVNNAGIYSAEKVTARRDLAGAEAMITTNVLGPIRVTNAFVDHLSAQPGAAILNVSSGLAFVPFPAAPTYSATKAAIHAYTAAIRPLLKGKVEVIEIVPPQVQTELTPGQSNDPNSMPLDEYADEVMALLHATTTPTEVCVERVRYFREAEAKGNFDAALQMLADHS